MSGFGKKVIETSVLEANNIEKLNKQIGELQSNTPLAFGEFWEPHGDVVVTEARSDWYYTIVMNRVKYITY